MRENTIKAIVGSILKWDAIAQGCKIDTGGDNCPLCQMFSVGECFACPVKIYTGKEQCKNTLYYSIRKKIGNNFLPDFIVNYLFINPPGIDEQTSNRRIATVFLDIENFIEFLISLLPKDFNEENITWDFFLGNAPSAKRVSHHFMLNQAKKGRIVQ